MTRGRKSAAVAAALAALAVFLAAAGVAVLRSDWFRDQARRKLADELATATGGRVEIGAFAFDWRSFRARAENLTIHGSETADKPPLFHSDAISLDLKIISVLKRKVDLAALDVVAPRIYLIVFPDGRTNVPEPKVAGGNARNPLAAVVDLAIGRFSLRRGVFEVESRSRTPFDVSGRSLAISLAYDRAAKRYAGAIQVQPLDVKIPGFAPTPVDVTADLTIERDRVAIRSATLRTGASELRVSGAMENLNAPRASFTYDVRASQSDVGRFLETKLLESGVARVTGKAAWNGAGGFSATGVLHAANLEYRDAYVRLRGFRAVGNVDAGPAGIDVTNLRLSGFYAPSSGNVPVDIRVGRASVRGADIRFSDFGVSALGGSFQGGALLESLDRFHVNGGVEGFEAKRIVAVYTPQILPWDARASGPLALEGSFRKSGDLRVSTNLEVDPEPGGAPVRGHLAARYDAASGILDLGHSTLALPASRVDFSGALGRQLRVHLETHDLNDFLAAAGADAATVPLKLRRTATFDGVVTGSMDDPYITGRAGLAQFTYGGTSFDALTADVTATSRNLRVDNAILSAGAMHLQIQAAASLDRWSICPDCDVFGSASLRGAPLAQIASMAAWQGGEVSGTADITAQLTGTAESPIVRADIAAAKGGFGGEPFDHVAAHVNYAAHTLEISGGDLTAGAKQVRFSALFTPAAAGFSAGRWKVQASSNTMPLDQIRTLAESRPGIAGTVRAGITTEFDVRPARPGESSIQVTALQTEIAAQGLRLGGQMLGDARLTAATNAGTLRAHLDSNFAGSSVHGDGSWRLEGDYPGSATIAFSGLDLVRLREWLAPPTPDRRLSPDRPKESCVSTGLSCSPPR